MGASDVIDGGARVEMHGDDFAQRRRVERQAAGEREESDDAERVEIARGVDRLAGDLLGTRVVRAAGDHAVARARVGVRRAGDAEVGDERALRSPRSSRMLSALTSRWTMPARVRVGQRPRDLAEHARRLMRRQRTARRRMRSRERLAVDVRHDEVDEAAGFVDAMDRDDVRVRQPRGHLRFAKELLAHARATSASAGGSTLIATSRASRTSRAR